MHKIHDCQEINFYTETATIDVSLFLLKLIIGLTLSNFIAAYYRLNFHCCLSLGLDLVLNLF